MPCYYIATYSLAHLPELRVEICMYTLITVLSLLVQLTLQLVANQNQLQHRAHTVISGKTS